MKVSLILFILLTPVRLIAQVVDLSQAASERKLEAIAYDGSYLVPDYSTTKEQKAGLVGQEITIVDIFSEYNLTDSTGKHATDSDLKDVEAGTWIIEEFINDGYSGKFRISKGERQWIAELDPITNAWFINKGFETLKNKLVGKRFNSFLKGLEVEGIDEAKFKLDGDNQITVKEVQYAKLSSTEYSVVIFFDNGLIAPYDPGGTTQPNNEGWIMIGGQFGMDLLVEMNALKKYLAANVKFVNQLRNGKVALGMTEEQTRLAWGIPKKSHKNVGGYDKANDYGERILYFKKGILALIK